MMNDDPVELAFRQAVPTVTTYFLEAKDAIDKHFYPGYAEKHPELIGSLVIAATNDLHAMLLHSDTHELVQAASMLADLGDALRDISASLDSISSSLERHRD